MTSDDETLNLIVQRPGDETVRIAEASVGDIRSALKRAREAALAEAGPGEREQVEGLWALIGVVVSTRPRRPLPFRGKGREDRRPIAARNLSLTPKAARRASGSKSLAGVSTRPPTESTRIAQTCGFRVL